MYFKEDFSTLLLFNFMAEFFFLECIKILVNNVVMV